MMLLAASSTVFAHHALGVEFDTAKTVTLTGQITRVVWSNPHVRVYIEVRDKSSKAENWEVDMGSPNMEALRGLKVDTFRPGDWVRVDAYPARNGSNAAYAKVIASATR